MVFSITITALLRERPQEVQTRELPQAHLARAQVWESAWRARWVQEVGWNKETTWKQQISWKRLVKTSISRTIAAATSAVLAERQMCQATTTRYEEPMVETARTVASLPGLRRTGLRACQKDKRLTLYCYTPTCVTHFWKLPVTVLCQCYFQKEYRSDWTWPAGLAAVLGGEETQCTPTPDCAFSPLDSLLLLLWCTLSRLLNSVLVLCRRYLAVDW